MINGGSVLVTHYGKGREQNDKDKHLKPTITQLANPFQHPHPKIKTNKKNYGHVIYTAFNHFSNLLSQSHTSIVLMHISPTYSPFQ